VSFRIRLRPTNWTRQRPSPERRWRSRDEGVDIEWVDSEVLTNDNDEVVGTFCHYRAESEEAVREHAERAGLPATKVTRRGEPLSGE